LAGSADGNFIILSGKASHGDKALLRTRPGLASGLHHVGVEVWDERDLVRSVEGLGRKGMKVEREIDHPARHCVCIKDPDGIRLQFYVNRDWRAATIESVEAEDQPYLF
jgi:catechol 2,3-dioxygenase